MIDFRSDTVTHPTDEMREAMFKAEVGDDVYGDDGITNLLEQKAAELVGKEAALFVPSGTFGNQLAVLTHTQPGCEVVLDETCHIVQHEAGACGLISGVNLRCIPTGDGLFDYEDLERRIRKHQDIHCPRTGLICIENAHSNGKAFPSSRTEHVWRIARNYGIPVHLDGARIFNAAAAAGEDAAALAVGCDSVMFCLSKGLCAPIGSMLAGTEGFIAAARRNRKIMGGGMRQTGILASAGIIALERMRTRLAEDHINARRLATKLAEIPGIVMCGQEQNINMVFADISRIGMAGDELVSALMDRGILCNPADDGVMRFVTHYYINGADIDYAVRCIRDILNVCFY